MWVLAIAAALAPAAGAAKSGAIQVYSSGAGVTNPIVITGAVTDYGNATSVNRAGKPTQNGNFEKIVLKKGGFTVDTTQLNKLLNHVKPTFSKTQCWFAVKGSGPTTLTKGTGAYAGITGTVNVTVDFVSILPRLASGKCNFANSAKPIAQFGNVTGSGTASY
jgi:hypothetical protein